MELLRVRWGSVASAIQFRFETYTLSLSIRNAATNFLDGFTDHRIEPSVLNQDNPDSPISRAEDATDRATKNKRWRSHRFKIRMDSQAQPNIGGTVRVLSSEVDSTRVEHFEQPNKVHTLAMALEANGLKRRDFTYRKNMSWSIFEERFSE